MAKTKFIAAAILIVLTVSNPSITIINERLITNGAVIDKTAPVILKASENNEAFLAGKQLNGQDFQIPLPYNINDVLLKQAAYIDFTNDNIDELCVVLDISNTAVSDSNSIYIYDMSDLSLLFPTEEMNAVYSGLVIGLDGEEPLIPKIQYKSYIKIYSVAYIKEDAIAGWVDNEFKVLEYKRKLLALDDQAAVFLDGCSQTDEGTFAELSIVYFGDAAYEGEEIQRINIKLSDSYYSSNEIIDEIDNPELIMLEDRNGDGCNDIIIKNNSNANMDQEVVYYWDGSRRCFLA